MGEGYINRKRKGERYKWKEREREKGMREKSNSKSWVKYRIFEFNLSDFVDICFIAS